MAEWSIASPAPPLVDASPPPGRRKLASAGKGVTWSRPETRSTAHASEMRMPPPIEEEDEEANNEELSRRSSREVTSSRGLAAAGAVAAPAEAGRPRAGATVVRHCGGEVSVGNERRILSLPESTLMSCW